MKTLAALAILFAPLATAHAAAQPVTLEVHIKLTDPDYKPLAGVPVRLVFASDASWQNASAGGRAMTDQNGEAVITTRVALEKVRKQVPSNFVSDILSGAQPADRLEVGAELPAIGFNWLYVVDLYRFSSGDVLLDDSSIYTPDAKGNFTLKARHDEAGWHMPELQGLVLTSPLYEAWNYMLQPASGGKWKLDLAFKKSPDPVRR